MHISVPQPHGFLKPSDRTHTHSPSACLEHGSWLAFAAHLVELQCYLQFLTSCVASFQLPSDADPQAGPHTGLQWADSVLLEGGGPDSLGSGRREFLLLIERQCFGLDAEREDV